MAGNPLVPQGTLNLLKASVVWASFPALNVTASFLDKSGITLRLEGEASMQHGTMAGVVQSPQPYLPVSVVIPLLKTQALSDQYKAKMEADSLIGDGTVYPDVNASGAGLKPYQISNMSIQSVGELNFGGTTPVYGVTLKGIYLINSNLWN